jgi:hypothetical protein
MPERLADLRALVFATCMRGQLPPQGHRRTVAGSEQLGPRIREPLCRIWKRGERGSATMMFGMTWKEAPVSRPVQRTGSVKSFPILGGLHQQVFGTHKGSRSPESEVRLPDATARSDERNESTPATSCALYHRRVSLPQSRRMKLIVFQWISVGALGG